MTLPNALTAPAIPTSFAPPATLPTMPTVVLSEDEQRIAGALGKQLAFEREALTLHGLYYDGEQAITDLGISIPPQLQGLSTVIGWPQIGVDAIEERCDLEGFRLPGSPDIDDDLAELWQANNLDEEAPLAHLDALIYGRAYLVGGSAPDDGSTAGQPLITVESPLAMTAMWDARKRAITAALQLYRDDDPGSDTYGQERAALYLDGVNVYLAKQGNGSAWEVADRDEHGLPPMVERMANRQRTTGRAGTSEITRPVRATTDRACRTLLGAEVAREFFGAPQRWAVGIAADAFQTADGQALSAWQTYIGRILALERDENGDLPAVGQFAAHDPSPFTKLIDMDTQIIASLFCLPPHYFGLLADANPASADAIRVQESRLVKRAQRKHVAFGGAWESMMRKAVRLRDGKVPDTMHRLEAVWVDPTTPTPGATTDATQKLVAAGVVPATSSVLLKRNGFTPVERMQIEADRRTDGGQAVLAELASSVEARDARAGVSIAKEVTSPAKAAAPGAPPPAAPSTTAPPTTAPNAGQ